MSISQQLSQQVIAPVQTASPRTTTQKTPMNLKIEVRLDLAELSSKTASTMLNKAWKGLNRQFFAAGASSSYTSFPPPSYTSPRGTFLQP